MIYGQFVRLSAKVIQHANSQWKFPDAQNLKDSVMGLIHFLAKQE